MESIPAELILRVPGCESGDPPLSMRPLAGGRGVNSVWRVVTRDGDFVLRLRHEPIDRPGAISRFELASHRLAAEAGLAPRVLDAAPDGRWLLMEFVPAPVWSDSQLLSAAGIDALGEILRRLHSLDCGTMPRMDASGIARGYFETIVKRSTELVASATELLRSIERETCELDMRSGRAALTHGDLVASNIVGAKPVLVDWEYAQVTDPTWDLACLLVYYPSLESRFDLLAEICGLNTATDRQILSQEVRLFSHLNCLWQWSNR